MPGVRAFLAAVLGIGLGVALIAYPGVFVRIQTAGRLPSDRGGEYGADAPPPTRWRWGVRLVGVGCLLAGLYFAATAVGYAAAL